MRNELLGIVIAGVVAVIAVSCGNNRNNGELRVTVDSTAVLCNGITFTDITANAGITWQHCNGAFGMKYFPEIKGSGCAIIDYNNDGWPDLLLVNSMHWPGHLTSNEPTMALYRNNKDGTFTDVTKAVGLAAPMFGMGVAVGDYDNDGWDDVFITAYGHDHLFHNDHGIFKDVSMRAGVAGDSEWHTSAMFIDYNNDGKLDLFVCSYCDWTPDNDLFFAIGGTKTYGTPDAFHGLTNHLYRNNGNGTFTDVTRIAGVNDPASKALGVALLDFNNDGYPDIAVACDLTDNKLYRNNKDGTFTDISQIAGIAAGAAGKHRSGMGIDCGDFDNDGKFSIVIGNFLGEPTWVYKQKETEQFADCATECGIGLPSCDVLKFAVDAADFDHDGFLDILTADGHVQPEKELANKKFKFKEPMQLFRNLGSGKYAEIVSRLHGPLQSNISGRGIALGDLFNTGNIDALVTTNDSTPLLLRNDTKNGNGYIEVRLHGVHSNRDGIGAKITAICSGWRQSQFIHSGSSYESANQLIANFGLGANRRVDTLIVRWDAYSSDTLKNIAGNQRFTIIENDTTIQPYLPH